MGRTHPKFTAAVVQAAPVFMDLEGTIAKTISLMEKAAQNGAKLIAFPETWIPGYPVWLWMDSPLWGMQFVQNYSDNSLIIESEQMEEICAAAARLELFVSLGFSEKSNGSLYMAQSLIGPDGQIVFSRRKLKPTHVERSLYGEGDGRDFQVADTELGMIGSLCCWEHLQPLSKYAMYAMNEQIHIAAWPTFSIYNDHAYALGAEVNLAASRTYAVEGQCFVLAPTIVTTQDVREQMVDKPGKEALLNIGGGYSAIFAPDGRMLTEHLKPDEEGILYADIDLGLISLSKVTADPTGHYSRPDVTQLLLNRDASDPVVYSRRSDMSQSMDGDLQEYEEEHT